MPLNAIISTQHFCPQQQFFLLYEFFVFLLVHVLFALLLFEFGILFHDTPDTVGHLCRHSHEARQGRDELVDEREDSIMNVEEDEVKSKKKTKEILPYPSTISKVILGLYIVY